MPNKGSRGKGWRRIGILLSVLWFVGFGLALWSYENNRIGDIYGLSLNTCGSVLNTGIEALGGRPILDTQDKIDDWDRRSEANWAKYKKCKDDAGQAYGRQTDDLFKGIP